MKYYPQQKRVGPTGDVKPVRELEDNLNIPQTVLLEAPTTVSGSHVFENNTDNLKGNSPSNYQRRI